MDYPYFNYLWILSDHLGKVGVFITAGEAPISVKLMERLGDQISLVEDFLLEMPIIADVEMLYKYNRPDAFIDIAKRGFLVFDWTNIHRVSMAYLKGYEKVAKPSQLISVDELSEELKNFLKELPVLPFSLEESSIVDVNDFVPCIHPDES